MREPARAHAFSLLTPYLLPIQVPPEGPPEGPKCWSLAAFGWTGGQVYVERKFENQAEGELETLKKD